MREQTITLAKLPYRLFFRLIDLNIWKTTQNCFGLIPYLKDIFSYSMSESTSQFKISIRYLNPCLGDRYNQAGVARGDYFHQDLWMARKIFKANPDEHWDIGSRIDGFITHLLTFRTVNIIDIRNLDSNVSGLNFHCGDVTSLKIPDQSIESLSCLHAMEHVGLGRYGDGIDSDGCFKGMRELQRVLKPGGYLYFSVPLGKERVEFNAHRVFNPQTIIRTFSELDLTNFAVVLNGQLHELIEMDSLKDMANGYACGLFIFKRPVNEKS